MKPVAMILAMVSMGVVAIDSARTASATPDTFLTPVRVTIKSEGTRLGFVHRSCDYGSEAGYRDVFMVIAVTQPDGSMRIDFAHKDIQFANGSARDAETIYMTGIIP